MRSGKETLLSFIAFELYSYPNQLTAPLIVFFCFVLFFINELPYVCASVTAVWGKNFIKRFQRFSLNTSL